MSRYQIEGSVVDTEKATHRYTGKARKAGYGHISDDLYRSRRGRWYVIHDHSWCEDGRLLDYAEWVSPEEAVRLLLLGGMDEEEIVTVHPDLADALAQVSE